MDVIRPDGGPATTPDTAARDVREAIQRLRSALDVLESALEGPSVPHVVVESGRWTSGSPSQPEPVAYETPASKSETNHASVAEAPSELSEVAAPGGFGWTASGADSEAAPAREEVAPAPEAESAPEAAHQDWGQWTSPPALKDGGWPAPRGVPDEGGRRSDDSPSLAASGASSEASTASPEEEDVREQVRRAVESLRAELGGLPDTESPDAALEDGPSAEPEYEPHLGDHEDWTSTAQQPATPPDSDDVREQVRRAVEEARAELAGGNRWSDDAASEGPRAEANENREVPSSVVDAPGPEMQTGTPSALAEGSGWPAPVRPEPRLPHYETLVDERLLMPATIVIDDAEGRVELVRVYRTLTRLERAATATLANYSSHQVTVQLEERELPSEQEIVSAVRYAFDRECTVEFDGNRASVNLSGGKSRAA